MQVFGWETTAVRSSEKPRKTYRFNVILKHLRDLQCTVDIIFGNHSQSTDLHAIIEVQILEGFVEIFHDIRRR